MKIKWLLGFIPFVLGLAAVNAVADDSYEDKPIEEYRLQLLDLGFSGVSKIPLRPHIKNRSRAQLTVVETCLELGQAKTAERYIVPNRKLATLDGGLCEPGSLLCRSRTI